MSLVARTFCSHIRSPDGTLTAFTMIIQGAMTADEFVRKLEVKIKDKLPEGQLFFAAKEGDAETLLNPDDKVMDVIKGAYFGKCG